MARVVDCLVKKLEGRFPRIKIWLGYQKGLSLFISNRFPHLKHVVVTQWHIHIEILIFFMDRCITKVLFYA
jgi:hypothetical protein